jgi:hypothetical protein
MVRRREEKTIQEEKIKPALNEDDIYTASSKSKFQKSTDTSEQ